VDIILKNKMDQLIGGYDYQDQREQLIVGDWLADERRHMIGRYNYQL
jgi:hypothetical protein